MRTDFAGPFILPRNGFDNPPDGFPGDRPATVIFIPHARHDQRQGSIEVLVVFHLWNIYRYITLCHGEIGGSKREGHRRGDSTMETSAPAQAQAFLREIEREQAAALAAIRESLRQFAHAEYWYMRGGREYFALLIMTAPNLEAQRLYHRRRGIEGFRGVARHGSG
jgi:hypothetical protein